MKPISSPSRTLSLLLALVLTASFSACSGGKKTDSSSAASQGGQSVKLSCGPGEVADATGVNKKALNVLPTLYDSKISNASKSTMPSFQAVYHNASGNYVVRGPRHARIALIVNDAEVALTPIHTPILTATFTEQGGKVVLLAGTYAGLTVYDVTSNSITERTRYTQWGEVRGVSVSGDQIYLIANAGKALIRTSFAGLEAKDCGQMFYDSAEHVGTSGRAKDLLYIAAVKDGVYAFARTVPAYRFDLIPLWELIKAFLTTSPTNIDFRVMEGDLLFIAADGATKTILPTVGNYNHFLVSDLTQFTENRVIAAYWAVKESTWQAFSSQPLSPVLPKFVLAIKLFAESKSGGVILENGEVKRSMVLDGITLPTPVTISGITIEELPHFSLSIAPAAAVDGNRFLLKGIRALNIWDLSQVDDANVITLPLTEVSPSTANMPKGYYSSFKALGEKLFLDGYGSDGSGHRVQNNYNLTAHTALPAPFEGFQPKLNFSLDIIPLAALRQNVFVIKSGKFRRQSVTDFTDKTDITFSPPSGYAMGAFPVVFASPAGETKDQVAFAYNDSTNKKLAIELKNPKDGTTTAKVENVDMGTATGSATLSPLALSDNMVVAAVNVPGPAGWSVKAFRIDSSVSPANLVPLEKDSSGGTTNVAESSGGLALSVKGLVKNGNAYSVLVLTHNGGTYNIERVDFTHEDNTNIFTSPAKNSVAVAAPVGDLVADATQAYIVDKTGAVTAYDRATLTAKSVGKITTDPTEKVPFGFVSLSGNNLYLTGLSNKQLFKLYKLDLSSGKATAFNRHNYLIGHATDQMFVGLDLTGGGIEAFKL